MTYIQDGSTTVTPNPNAESNAMEKQSPFDQQPAFLIGVTGHWDLLTEEKEIKPLQERVRRIFRLLRHGATGEGVLTEDAAELRAELFRLDMSGCDKRERVEAIYDTFLKEWPGLKNTPIVILSSLAPGADQLVANVALEDEFRELNFHVVAPTPFPVPQFEPDAINLSKTYCDSSTFVRDGLTELQIKALQDDFETIVNNIPQSSNLPRGFTVALEADLKFDKRDEWFRQCETDIPDQNSRRRRYRAAGEYIAAYSHLMLAVWDHIDDFVTTEGTAAIVEVRRAGLTPGLLPVSSQLPLPLGPTLQLFTHRRKRTGSSNTPDPDWKLRWLFPAATRDEVPELHAPGTTCSCRMDGLQHGLSAIVGTAHQLNGLAEREVAESAVVKEHLDTFLSYCEPGSTQKQSVRSELHAIAPEFLLKIQRVADFRRRATNEQRQEGKEAKTNITWLFLYTLGAALLLHAFSHWHPQNEPHDASHAEPHDAASANHQGEHGEPSKNSAASEQAALPAKADSQVDAKADAKVEEKVEAKVAGTTAHGDSPAAVSDLTAKPSPGKSGDSSKSAATKGGWDFAGFMARLGRLVLGVAGVYFVVRGLLYFSEKRPRQHAEKDHDLRALAESARVQMAWFIAGVGRSTSANYMLRQRGEFNWIRQAVRSVALPYEEIQWMFRRLERPLQIRLLKCVLYNWLRGHKTNAQANYFADARKKLHDGLHFWHKLGAVLAFSGIFLACLQVLAAVVDVFIAGHMLESIAATLWAYHFGWLLLVLPGLAGWVLYQRKLDPKWSLLAAIEHFVEHYLQTVESNTFAHHERRFRSQMRINFCTYAVPAAVLALLIFLLAVFLSRYSWLPAVGHLTTILSAVVLVSGGLSIAWPEKNLSSELAFQYGTMERMFQLAANHMESTLKRLEELDQIASDPSVAEAAVRRKYRNKTDDEIESLVLAEQQAAPKVFADLVVSLQDSLFELGQEALDENAEWLILHRSRPLEPVMAG